MADDFDDGKGKKDKAYLAQFDNAVNDIKSQIRSTNPAELVRLNASITSLLSSDLPSEILSKLKDLQAVVSEREEQAEQVVRYTQEGREAEEARLLQERIEFLEKEAHIANEVREKELEEHVKNYKDFQGDFQKQLKADSDLLDQAIKDPNSLTPEQKAQLTGQYAADKQNEKEAAKKKDQEKSKWWKEHYAIKNKAKESIAYRQGEIKKNDTVINHPNAPEPLREQKRQDNAVHEKEIVKHEESLAIIKPAAQHRETERSKILALVNGGNPELAVGMLKRHYSKHIDEYDKEKQQDANHQGYNELHSMVMALGGHEKLGLPKSEHPITEQQTLSTLENAHKRAQAIQKTLEQTPVHPNINDELKNEAHEVGLIANKTKPPGTKSKFAQNAKKMAGRG